MPKRVVNEGLKQTLEVSIVFFFYYIFQIVMKEALFKNLQFIRQTKIIFI